MIIDFRRARRVKHSASLHTVCGEALERVDCFKNLRVYTLADLTWSRNISHQVGKAQQWLCFLRKPKQGYLLKQLLINFYQASIESLLTFASCTVEDMKDLRGAVRMVERVIASLGHIYTLSGSMGKPAVLQRTPPTLDIDCPPLLPQKRDTGQSQSLESFACFYCQELVYCCSLFFMTMNFLSLRQTYLDRSWL